MVHSAIAMGAIRLGATDWVRSIVICHPGGFTTSEAKAIKVRLGHHCVHIRSSGYSCLDSSGMSLRRKLNAQPTQKARALTALIDDLFFNKNPRTKAEAVFAERKSTDSFVDYEFKDHKGQ